MCVVDDVTLYKASVDDISRTLHILVLKSVVPQSVHTSSVYSSSASSSSSPWLFSPSASSA